MDPKFNRNSPSFFYSCHFTKLFMFLFLYNYINTVKRKRNLNRKKRQHRKRYTTHLWLMNDLLKFKWYARATKAREILFYLCCLKYFCPTSENAFCLENLRMIIDSIFETFHWISISNSVLRMIKGKTISNNYIYMIM